MRPRLEAFNLETESWLFTVDPQERMAGASRRGAFGIDEFRRAVELAPR